MPVYFIRAGEDGLVKIGFSANVASRIQSLQTASSQKLKLIRIVEGSVAHERAFHRLFASLRINGEWFQFSEDMLTADVALASRVVGPKESNLSPLGVWLERNGFRQKHLVDALGWPKSTVSRIVSGSRKPTLKQAVQLEDATGGLVTFRDFVQWAPPSGGVP